MEISGSNFQLILYRKEPHQTTKVITLKTICNKNSKVKKENLKIEIKREIDLYSPEYLAKKHGITLNEVKNNDLTKNKVSFGFFNSLIFFIVIIIAISRGLYFAQDFIVQNILLMKFILITFFKSIRNLFEIWKNLISSY